MTGVHLQSGDTQLECWVDKKVQIGNWVTLKDSDDPERLWKVTKVRKTSTVKSALRQNWKVGGIK